MNPITDATNEVPELLPGWLNVLPWVLPLAGFLLMYIPVYRDVAGTSWQTDEHAHEPLIAAVCLWLAWRDRGRFLASPLRPRPLSGGLTFAGGLILYAFAVSQDIPFLELLSQWPIIIGAILLLRGPSALASQRFPLGFLLFMLPPPGFLVAELTQPMKAWVSAAADQMLYSAGYPIAREGVTLVIGQYQLLVADACSGLHSLIALAAMGVLFIHISARSAWLHTLVMAASIVPLALLANLVRVIVLVLVTWYFGDEVGQGYLHGVAGMVVFVAAMAGMVGLDLVLARVLRSRPA